MDSKYGSPMVKDGAIGNAKMFQYKGTISFQSDQELTPEQLDQLVFAIEVQIEEPADANGNDEEFSTREVLVSLEVSE
jgi:hypothetical protein